VVAPALFDTNILIDFLNGIPQARREIKRHPDRAISVISWMEVMAGASPDNEQETALFLGTFQIIPVTSAIADSAVAIRRQKKLKLPDAIILATAQVEKRLLLTRNTRDFPPNPALIRIPYQL
jgi:hypothetical protein